MQLLKQENNKLTTLLLHAASKLGFIELCYALQNANCVRIKHKMLQSHQ